jgi:hypothetical protein
MFTISPTTAPASDPTLRRFFGDSREEVVSAYGPGPG